MKTCFKKVLSLALTMILVLSAVPFAAHTAGADTTYSVGDIIVFGSCRSGIYRTISSETVKEPTDTEAGKKVYTAAAEFEGETYTDAVEKTIPAQGDGLCKWCGEDHSGSFWQRIVGFFHSIAYFFAHLFGQR